jgi:hypothetical protein
MSDIGINKNQVVLPNEKNKLIEALQKELDLLKKDIDDKKISGAALELALRHRDMLQNILNKFLAKKGVITPDETNNALATLDDSKKLRLGKDFKIGLNRFTFNIVAIIGVGVLAYYFIKKRSEK